MMRPFSLAFWILHQELLEFGHIYVFFGATCWMERTPTKLHGFKEARQETGSEANDCSSSEASSW